MVTTKHCLRVRCSTNQTKETSSCHMESDWEVEELQVCGGDQKHPATTSMVQRDDVGSSLWWSIPRTDENWLRIQLCLELGRWAVPADTAAQASLEGGNQASGSLQALLVAKSQHLSSLTIYLFVYLFIYIFYICFMFTLASNSLALLQALNRVTFPLFFFLPGLRYSKESPQGKYKSLRIGTLSTEKIQAHKRPSSQTAKFYSLGANSFLLISREAEGFCLF